MQRAELRDVMKQKQDLRGASSWQNVVFAVRKYRYTWEKEKEFCTQEVEYRRALQCICAKRTETLKCHNEFVMSRNRNSPFFSRRLCYTFLNIAMGAGHPAQKIETSFTFGLKIEKSGK